MQKKYSKKLITLTTSIIVGSSIFSTSIGVIQAETQIELVQNIVESATGKVKTSQHFGKDKASAEKWAKDYFKKWKGKINNNQKKLLGDSSRIKKMNHDIEKFRRNAELLSNASKKDMELMDKALKEPSAKLKSDLHVYKKLKSTDLGYKGDSFYKTGTNTIDRDKFNQLKHDFQYGIINNFMEVDLTEHSADKSEPIQLQLKIPEGIGVGHIDKDQLLLERNHGIEIKKTSIIVNNGKQVIKVQADLVPKDKIQKKIKATETEINTKFGTLMGATGKLIQLDTEGFYASTLANKTESLMKQLTSNVPNELLAEMINKLNADGAITLTDMNLVNRNENTSIDAKGFYDPSNKSIYVNLNHKDHIHQQGSDLATLVHQFGKAVDELFVENTVLSETDEFKKIYKQEKNNLTDLADSINEKEFFAAVFRDMYAPTTGMETIQKKVPKTVTFIKGKINATSKDKFIDFKVNKEAAREWGNKAEKAWNIKADEKIKINDFLDNKNDIRKNYKEITFSMKGLFENETKDLIELDDIFNKAALTTSIVTYKNVESTVIGFNKTLIEDNKISADAEEKFKKQFLGKDIKFDGYLDTHLNEQNISNTERVILKVNVPSNIDKHSTKAGVILNNNEYKVLIDNNYVFHVNKVSKVVKGGLECLQVEITLKKSLDFKNDINARAHKWGTENYGEWAENLTDSERNELEGYARQDYKEINNYLRNQDGNGNEKFDKKIQHISEALNKKTIPENITVYRWCGMPEFGYKIGDPLPPLNDFEEKFLNTIKEDKGYLSTSLSSERLSAFAPRKFILRLQVPKGSKGAYLSALGGFASEKEVLLEKGSAYHIDKITEVSLSGIQKGTRYIVDATLLIK